MYDAHILIERLKNIQDALGHILRRSATVDSPVAFEQTDAGRDRLDAICMSLIAVGEAFRQIDDKTEGSLLARYPTVDWRGVIGVRNVIAHGYFDVDAEQIFNICKHDIPSWFRSCRR